MENVSDTKDKQSLHCLYIYYLSFPYSPFEPSFILSGIPYQKYPKTIGSR